MSSRPSSGGRSFLDELLANDIDKVETPKRKSVRFLDDEDNGDILGSNLIPPSARSASRSITLSDTRKDTQKTLDSLDWAVTESDSTGGRQSSNISKSANKSGGKGDWLGLGADEDGTEKYGGRNTQEKFSINQSLEKNDDYDDRMTSGLSSRRGRMSGEQTKSNISPSLTDKSDKSDNSWMSIKKKAEESKQKESSNDEQKILPKESIETIDKVVSLPTEQIISMPKLEAFVVPNLAEISNSQSSILLLQTQIKMLELEKSYLQQTLDQIKKNHCEELTIMTTLHEQQMRMTTNMYKRHEDMIQEERDRRINDLKAQLNQTERDMEDLRKRNNERIQSLENEWRSDTERLKEIHTDTVKKLIEQHEYDINRIRKIKEQEIESVNALQNCGSSLENLILKWENNAQQIESLHRNVISKQEEILKEKFTDIEFKDKRLDSVEINWNSLIKELEKERNRFGDDQRKLTLIIEEQQNLLLSEHRRLNDEKLEIENEKRKLNDQQKRYAIEVNNTREMINKERDVLHEESMKLKDEKTLLEIDKKKHIVQEMEWKHQFQEEKDNINKMYTDIEEKRTELHKQHSQLQQRLLSLQNEQHQLEQKKAVFDIEKIKMRELAEDIANRAEELESLSEIAFRERDEGNAAMDEAERLKADFDYKLEVMERSYTDLKKEDERINKDKKTLQDQWKALRDTKDSLVCSLCGSGLNRAKIRNPIQELHTFPSLFTTPDQFDAFPDNDRALLIWQITAQQDATLLAEETAFVNALQRTNVIHYPNTQFYSN